MNHGSDDAGSTWSELERAIAPEFDPMVTNDVDQGAGVVTIRIRTLRRAAMAVGSLSALFVFLTWIWFLSPAVDNPTSADAIVVLGGEGDRTSAARALVADGVTDEVWISSVWIPEAEVWTDAACRPLGKWSWPIAGANVECFSPIGGDTRSEARAIAQLAEEHRWETVVVVATTDQVTRARRLIERCYDGEILMVDTSHPDPLLLRIIYEWGAGLETTIRRGC